MNKECKRWIAISLSTVLPSLGLAQTKLPAKAGPVGAASPQVDLQIDQRKEREFIVFDPHYKEAKAERIAKARVLGKQVIVREAAGQNTQFSHQILSEIIWLLASTADFKRIDQMRKGSVP